MKMKEVIDMKMEEKIDTDSCKNVEAEFSGSYQIISEKAISLNKNYIMKMCGNSKGDIGMALSDSTCEIFSYNESNLTKVCKFSEHSAAVSEVRFSPQNENHFYSGSLDGSIRLWDIRTGEKSVMSFEENSETKLFTKPMNAFDISCDERVLCGGSEMIESDAFMLFWDIRNKNLLGAYWNSHTDDIVQVEFNKSKSNTLVTGGVDGLINVFDIIEQTEDDALLYSLSTDCAIDKLSWISDSTVSCLTQNVDIQLWNVETADQEENFTRESITKAMKRTSVDDCYVIDIFKSANNQTHVLGGSYSNTGDCLRTIQIRGKELQPLSDFKGNKQIVRCSWCDLQNDILVTGGEAGILSLWKNSKYTVNSSLRKKTKILPEIENLKIHHKKKPYSK